MKINQVNFSYSPTEDRLLFRFNTPDKSEFRMWLTRAMCIKLLGQLNRIVKISLLREKPGLPSFAFGTVEEFWRNAVFAKTDYVQTFSSGAEVFPLGLQPILVTDIFIDSSAPVSVVTFRLAVQQVVGLSLNHDMGVAISKLLSDVLDGVDWGHGIAKGMPIAGIGNLGEKMMLH